MILHDRLVFGIGGNAQSRLGEGWAAAEAGFHWATGAQSTVRMTSPVRTGPLAVELALEPFVRPPLVPRQRVAVVAGTTLIGKATLRGPATLCFDLPAAAIPPGQDWLLTLTTPDSLAPASLGLGGDERPLALMMREIRLIEPLSHAQLPRSLAPLVVAEPTPAALDAAVRARTGLGTVALLQAFESLGHNCEFGLMQRDLDAEPLGLLRFGGIEPDALLAGIERAFAGIEEEEGLALESGRMNGREEYLVRDARFGVRLHTGQFLDEVAPDAVDLSRMARHLGFLQRQFAEVLREASRIFVLHHPGVPDAAAALPILHRLRSHGDNTLLYVTEHPTVPPGTVVVERAHLIHGYIDRLVPMNEAHRVNLTGWASLCANAYRAVMLAARSPP